MALKQEPAPNMPDHEQAVTDAPSAESLPPPPPTNLETPLQAPPDLQSGVEAPEQTPPPSDTPPQAPNQAPERRRGRKGLVGAALAGAAAIGVLVGSLVGGGDAAEERNRDRTEESAPAPGEESSSPQPEGEANEETGSTDQEVGEFVRDETSGTLQLTRVIPGEETIEVTRANNETLVVPTLRSPDDPNLFAESALALMSCYLTTGAEKCIGELTESAESRELLSQFRSELLSSGRLNFSDDPDEQVAIFDDPNNPVSFVNTSKVDGTSYIELIPDSEIYLTTLSDSRWQGPATHTLDSNSTDFFRIGQMKFQLDSSGQKIANIEFSASN